MLFGLLRILALVVAGETSTTSLVPSSFSFSSVLASSTIVSITVSLSVTSDSGIVSYSGSAFGLERNI